MNVFIAGLPLRTSECDLRMLLSLLDLLSVETHVKFRQNTFAFLRVPQYQVTFACDKYNGLEYRCKLLHVSAVKRVQSCRKCIQFGHSTNECKQRMTLVKERAPIVTPQQSIKFAEEWNSGGDSDEWPSRELHAEVRIEKTPDDRFRTPPCRRLRSRETPSSTFSLPSFPSLSQSSKKVAKHILAELREKSTAFFDGCHFRLIKASKVPTVLSRVVCGFCKSSIMVRNVPKHVSSKIHQKTAEDFATIS